MGPMMISSMLGPIQVTWNELISHTQMWHVILLILFRECTKALVIRLAGPYSDSHCFPNVVSGGGGQFSICPSLIWFGGKCWQNYEKGNCRWRWQHYWMSVCGRNTTYGLYYGQSHMLGLGGLCNKTNVITSTLTLVQGSYTVDAASSECHMA